MYQNVCIGDSVLEGEEVEQMVSQIISTLAQHQLSYDLSNYILDMTKTKLGERCFIKD